MTDPRRTSTSEDGFSLLEMLISIAILALVLAMLPGTFRLAHRTWDATATLDREAKRDGGRNFLLARLAEAMPLFEPSSSGLVSMAFKGTADTLSFIAPSPNGPDGAGLYRYTLAVQPQGSAGRNALVLTLGAYLPPGSTGGVAPASEDHVLHADIATAGFRYFGRKDSRAAPAWHGEWTRRDALPDLVELTIDDGRARGPGLQTIRVELRLRSVT